jgi:DNA modification methylase
MSKIKESKEWRNKLYYGDNIDVLRKYIKDESIDLCYIDPPFNSKRQYFQIYLNQGSEDKAQAQAFVDTWEWDKVAINGYDEIINNEKNIFSVQTIFLIEALAKMWNKKGSLLAYLVHMTLRITEIQRVLKPTGSFYLHCDPTASHYLKLVCDSIFCAKGGDFKNEISWRRHYSHNDGNKFGCIHDVILYYTKSEEYIYNRQVIPYDDEYIKKNYASIDAKTGKRYRSVSMNAAGQGDAKIFFKKSLTPPHGTHWRWSQDRIDQAIKDGVIFLTSNGVPRYKQFLDEMEGVPVQDTWVDFYSLSSHDEERLGYPTQKPEALLERMIKTSSNKGDTVLDAYCGCGTTVAVAEKLKRKWIGIDITYQSISLILYRLEKSYGKKIKDSIELSGVPEDIESAVALANKKEDKVRKEFEKWAVLSYSNNRAMINEKKGGDGGIDGIALIQDRDKDEQIIEMKRIVFSVKSDKTLTPAYLDQLKGKMIEKDVVMGIFICLYEPTSGMVKMAKEMGTYKNKLFNLEYPKLQIVSIKDYFDKGLRLNIPVMEVVKKAEYKGKEDAGQGKLFKTTEELF